MQREELQTGLNAATALLQKAVAAFNDDRFNQQPANGGWSAAQVIAHLLALETQVNKLLQMPGVAAERPFDNKIVMITTGLADEIRKYKSPENLVPTASVKSKDALMNALEGQRNILANHIDNLNLEELISSFKHPFMGRFTRFEWIHFVISHSNRHARQIERLCFASAI